jgi:hypothetical protein
MKYIEKSKSKSIRAFLHQYYGSVKYDIRMHVYKKSSFNFSHTENYLDYTEKFDSVEAVEITMPKVEFERLVDEHEELVDLKCFTGFTSVDLIKHDYGHMREQYFVTLNEIRIRNNNESVKKAYEHYQMLLNLAR